MRLRLLLRAACCIGMLCGAAMTLPGCSEMMIESHIFHDNDVNLRESSYGAADMLAHQLKGRLKPGTPIRVGMLTNAYPSRSTARITRDMEPLPAGPTQLGPSEITPPSTQPAPFGRVVTEQIAGRLMQLGFTIMGGSSPDQPGQAVLTGQYARASGRVLVNLRLLDAGSGRLIGSYDYAVPIGSEIHALLSPNESNTGFFHF